LINRIAPPDQLDAEVAAMARILIAKPPRVLAAGKKFFYEQQEKTIVEAYALASELITKNMLGEDAQEGVTAFVEKREPRWDP
jgi:enoyl-CoA hydratase/carnithine racemase